MKTTSQLPIRCSVILFLASWLAPGAIADDPASSVPSLGRGPKPSSVAVAEKVDRTLAEELDFEQLADQLAPQSDDVTFLRRAYLDLIGRLPPPERVASFAESTDPHKRARLIGELLEDPASGENWGNYWRDVIFYRKSEDRGQVGYAPTAQFLEAAFNANRPWNEIATEFITATGTPEDNGATGLILAHLGKPEETVAEISRVFLGIQIQCAQCHDHPFDDWTREQFHELAAFLPRVAVRPQPMGDKRTFAVVSNDRAPQRNARNQNQRNRQAQEHRMPDLDDPTAPGQVMQPVFFVDGQSLELGIPDAQRRAALADWITKKENVWFARAFVNRMWSELVGEPFYSAVDDMGPERTAKAPRTLDLLSSAFVESGYDVKWLYQTILLTETYQRAARPARNPGDPPFLSNTVHRLRADQIGNALRHVVGSVENRGRDRNPGAAARMGLSADFGFDPSEDRSEMGGSIPQSLVLMNSPTLSRLVALSLQRGTLSQILRAAENETDAIQKMYVQVLARPASAQEVRDCTEFLRAAASPSEGYQDIAWALINSAEFVHRY